MQIDFLGMQAFLCIVEQGGFLPAATHLNLSQTAVSHRLRKLEDSLGMKLLTRTTRAITLTDAGRALLPRVRKAMQELELSYDTVRQHAAATPRWLVFGCLPTLAVTQLSPALLRFATRHPDISVRVLDDSIGEIAEHVHNGTAAFGVSLASSNRFGLDMDVFAQEPFVLACPPRHRLARAREVDWERLRGEPDPHQPARRQRGHHRRCAGRPPPAVPLGLRGPAHLDRAGLRRQRTGPHRGAGAFGRQGARRGHAAAVRPLGGTPSGGGHAPRRGACAGRAGHARPAGRRDPRPAGGSP